MIDSRRGKIRLSLSIRQRLIRAQPTLNLEAFIGKILLSTLANRPTIGKRGNFASNPFCFSQHLDIIGLVTANAELSHYLTDRDPPLLSFPIHELVNVRED